MNHEIIIRTYYKDSEWLEFCLRSLEKYCCKYCLVTVACPSDSAESIKPIAKKYKADFFECEKINEDDYIGQMATKMFYDEISGADVIHHVDSDMVFSRHWNPQLMVNMDGNVIIGKQEYDQLQSPWRPIVEKLVGFEVKWEYNRIFPSAYPRWLYVETRNHLEKVAGKTMKQILKEVTNREFSECNVLGAVGEKLFADKLDFRDITRDEIPERVCACYWSWGGITPEVRIRIERALA